MTSGPNHPPNGPSDAPARRLASLSRLLAQVLVSAADHVEQHGADLFTDSGFDESATPIAEVTVICTGVRLPPDRTSNPEPLIVTFLQSGVSGAEEFSLWVTHDPDGPAYEVGKSYRLPITPL